MRRFLPCLVGVSIILAGCSYASESVDSGPAWSASPTLISESAVPKIPTSTGEEESEHESTSPLLERSTGVNAPIQNVGDSRQIILVTSEGYGTSHATLSAWQDVDDNWQQALGPWPARIGEGGFSTLGVGNRRQSTGTTPTGTYTITQGFGFASNPGTRMPWLEIDSNTWWPYDPQDPLTYNVLQSNPSDSVKFRRNSDWAEHLIEYWNYEHAFVIDFNIPIQITDGKGNRVASSPADTTAGGGIFLHISDGTATAGCVAVSREQMIAISAWLNPAEHPVIAMGTPAEIATL